MTVVGFVQAASGLSLLSAYVAAFDYVFVNVDEAHQLVQDQLAPVASRSQRMNLCMDKGQHIPYDRQSNHMGGRAELESRTYYSWERAVHGGSSLPSWHSLQEENVQTLRFSRRFGPIMCELIRNTCAEYGPNTTGIWSPVESCGVGEFTDAEKATVPETFLRFVMYKREHFSCVNVGARCCFRRAQGMPLLAGTKQIQATSHARLLRVAPVLWRTCSMKLFVF